MGAATAVTPWLTGATLGLGAVNTGAGIAQANSAAKAQENAMRAQAEQQRQLLQHQYATEARRRDDMLERAQARARVSFGSRGLSPTDGSAGALLNSIETQAGTEAADARSLFDWRLSGLDAGLASSLARIDDRRSDLLSGAHRTLGQVNQLLRWRKGMSLS
jgi:hypothetical protein